MLLKRKIFLPLFIILCFLALFTYLLIITFFLFNVKKAITKSIFVRESNFNNLLIIKIKKGKVYKKFIKLVCLLKYFI